MMRRLPDHSLHPHGVQPKLRGSIALNFPLPSAQGFPLQLLWGEHMAQKSPNKFARTTCTCMRQLVQVAFLDQDATSYVNLGPQN